MAEKTSLREQLEKIQAEKGNPEKRLTRLKDLVHANEPIDIRDRWAVYRAYSLCYWALGDRENWRRYIWASINSPEGQQRERQEESLSNYLFGLHYFPQVSDAELSGLHMLYNRFAQTAVPFPHDRPRHQHRKLRIGYIANRVNKSVLSTFYWALISAYDSNRFEVYFYGLNDEKDDETSSGFCDQVRAQVKALRLFPDGKNLHDIAQVIYDDEIDSRFDLEVHVSGGHTLRVLTYRPAPVQLSGIGYMSTSGTKAIDYFLGDRYLDPPGLHDEDFSEQIIRLPHSHFCYTPQEGEEVLSKLRYWQLHEFTVFGSFNNFRKLSTEQLNTWVKIIRRVPQSHLLLRDSSHQLQEGQRIKETLLAQELRPDQFTIEYADKHYLERYSVVDIALDTYPYTGGGTTCNALYMGVPVITRYGRRHGSRFGYSLLMNLGLEELTAPDEAGYIERAVALAGDRELLMALRCNLSAMMQHSVLMDSRQYMHDVECAYETIWQKSLQGNIWIR